MSLRAAPARHCATVLEAQSKEEAIELTERFLEVHGDEWDIECEVRQLDGLELCSEA